MKISALRKPSGESAPLAIDSVMRSTAAQDVARDPAPRQALRRRRLLIAVGAGAIALIALAGLVRGWLGSSHPVPLERLRIATVSRGHFVRDVAAQGTVIAAVSPTLFASAPGTISYAVRAGDTVERGAVLATLDSPELRNEFERERATLAGAEAALAREEIEIRRQNLLNQQQADLADADPRGRARTRARAIGPGFARDPMRPAQGAGRGGHGAAQLRPREGDGRPERDSLRFDLRTRRLERDRQSLVVKDPNGGWTNHGALAGRGSVANRPARARECRRTRRS